MHPGVHAHQGLHGIGVDVGDDHLGAVLEEVVGEPPAHLADAGDGDPAPGQGRLAPHVLGRRAHALEDAVGGEHRGVAGTAALGRAAGGPAGGLADDVHVGDVGADVAGGDVAAAERLDEAAVGAQQLGRLVAPRVADDDRLAAAVVEAGDGVLARHRPRQAQHVGQGLVGGGVGVEAGAAQARPECGVVQGDDRPQPGLGVGAEGDLLVAREVDQVGGHGGAPGARCGASTLSLRRAAWHGPRGGRHGGTRAAQRFRSGAAAGPASVGGRSSGGLLRGGAPGPVRTGRRGVRSAPGPGVAAHDAAHRHPPSKDTAAPVDPPGAWGRMGP